METDRSNYYLLKGLTLVFSIVFLGGSIFGLFFPDKMVLTYGEEVVNTNFLNLIPFIIPGILSTLLYLWIIHNFFRVRLDERGITILKIRNANMISWPEIEKINVVDWLWKGTIFKVQLKNSNTFYFHSDRPAISLSKMFSNNFETEMAKYIEIKKKEFSI